MFAFLTSWFRSKPESSRTNAPSKFSPTQTKLLPEAQFIVEVTAAGIVNHRPDGQEESVLFADLAGVIVETNDTGPWGTDVWWILVGRAGLGGCVYPGGATGEREALIALQRLPGFDHEAFLQAMASCQNARFLCWKSPESGPCRE